MSEGWFALHRGWRDNPLFKGEFSRADAWVWMIEKACWRPTRFDIRGKVVELDRGQFCATREQLSEAWQWSPSAVERFLTRLQTEQMIGRETGQGKSVITIQNYKKYQDQAERTGQKTGQESGQKSDRNRTAKEQGNKVTRIPKRDSAHESDDVRHAFDEWNSRAVLHGWAIAKSLTDTRHAKLKLRLAELGGMSGWSELLDRAGEARMLTGDRPRWFDLDFLIENQTNSQKVMEGKYDETFNGRARNRSANSNTDELTDPIVRAAFERHVERTSGQRRESGGGS